MGNNRIELSNPSALEALLDETQLENLFLKGMTVTGIVLEGPASTDEVEQMIEEEADTAENRSLRRRAALGDVVAGIAHQSRNIMTGVLSFAQIARRRNRDEKLGKLVDKIEAESFRCVELLSHVLILARSRDAAGGGHLEACSPALILLSACNLVEPKLAEKAIKFVKIDDPAVMPEVLGDTKALRDVFVNLLQNAGDATPADGTVQVTCETDDDSLSIFFDDTGPGVAPEHREQIFAPSFTTKGIGKGTGLGLAVSQQVVIEHGGELLIEESPLGGARFVVVLPVAGAAREE
jgi:signal transduction histidine kinase